MPNASKYIIDVANIRPGGSPIKGLYVGSSEKKYATLGNKCIYDKVLYELSVDDITNVEPNAQTVNITSYTSKKTHGNGVSDTLGITPSSKQVTANTSTASTKDTQVVVTQLTGTTATGASVTVTITQKKDYPTGITLSISPKSTIPASGGSITTALTNYTYSVKANYKSGNNNVDVTASSTISANVTGVTAASKGTSASTATVAGTVRFTASYTCNGVTKTSTVDVNIMQDKNEVVAYANPTFTLSPGNTTLPAGGGEVTGSVSAIQQVRTWSSTSTDTITPTSTTAWTAQTISCESRGTETGDTLTLGTTKVTVTANGKSTSKQYTVYQQANTFPYETYYGDVNVDSAAVYCGPIPVTGGTVYPSSGGTVIQWRRRTYTSGSYVDDWPDITSVATISYDPTSVYGASNAHSTSTPKRGTVTATWTSPYRSQDGVESASKSVDVYQSADSLVYSKTVYITSFDPATSTVANTGGNFTFTFYRANNYYYYWATDGPSGEFLQSYDNTGTTTLTSSNSNCTLNKTTNVSNGDSIVLTWSANDGTLRTSTITPGIGSGSHTSTQEEAGLRGPYYGLPQLDSVTLSCDDVPAGGGTVYPSWNGTVYQWRYYLNAAGEQVNGENIVITPSVSWDEDSVYASSLGTTAKGRTFITTCTASFTGLGGAAPTTKSINVYQQANSMTATTYGDVSVYLGNAPDITGHTISADGESFSNRGFYSSQEIRYYYTSGSYQNGTAYDEQQAITKIQCEGTGVTFTVTSSTSYHFNTVITIPPNTEQITKTITITCTAWGQNSKVGTVTYTFTQAAYVPPPTPTGYSFTITNESNYNLHLSFATTNGTFQQDFVGGIGEIVTVTSTTLPITVYEVSGSISPGSDFTKIVELYNNTGTITASFETSYNAWYGTGQITVNDTGANNITIIVS